MSKLKWYCSNCNFSSAKERFINEHKKNCPKYLLYGLQRSGTNILQTFIEKNFNIYLMNKNEKDRQSPYCKHFRIYNNKDLIPKTNKKDQYKNQYIVNSLEELDKLLGDSTHTNKYIIVYKNIFSWLLSIEKWAKNNKWITNSKMEFIEDYLNFIKKWYSIKNDRVIFIDYEDFLNISDDNNLLVNKLSVFFNKWPKKITRSFNKVNCSKKFTTSKKEYYINNEYMNLYTKKEVDKIKNNKIYQELIDYFVEIRY